MAKSNKQLTGKAEDRSPDPLADLLEQALLREFGPLVGGDDLCRMLGLASKEAFRQAEFRKQVPIPTFNIPHRRGKFALTVDLARWLAEMRLRSVLPVRTHTL